MTCCVNDTEVHVNLDGELFRLTPVYSAAEQDTSWTVLRAQDGRLFVHERTGSEWRLYPAPSWVAAEPQRHDTLRGWFGSWIPPIVRGVDPPEEPDDVDPSYTERPERLDPAVLERARRRLEAELRHLPLTPVWDELEGSGYAWSSADVAGSCHHYTAPLRGPFGELVLVIDVRRFDDEPWEVSCAVQSRPEDGVRQDLGLRWCLPL